jgi:aconitate hydratase
MAFDMDMLKAHYESFAQRVDSAKKALGRPFTLTEKILYAHLHPDSHLQSFARGKDYVFFAPDRVAMQDATAQMALLQFMMCGRDKTAVPSTVHCDHLIQAQIGATQDLKTPFTSIPRSMTSSLPYPTNTASGSGNPVRASFTRSCWKTMLFPAA